MHENPTTNLMEGAVPSMMADHVTVVMPTYNRRDFIQNLDQGKWNTLRVLLICDGCVPSFVRECIDKTKDYKHITVVDERPNRGVAYAKSAGIQKVDTPYFMFCDDDDYYVDYRLFLEELDRINLQHRKDILFATTPEVVNFGLSKTLPVYDRRIFHGKTGRDVLTYFVRTGEIHALCAGSLFRTADVLPLLPEPFFRVAEDAILLTRLCARYPERRIYITEHGRYMRRMHRQSLSNPHQYTLDKILMHVVALVVAAYYMEQMELLPRTEFIRLLLNRGKILLNAYGQGLRTAAFVGGLLLERTPEPHTEEAVRALDYLKAHREGLPPEFNAMLSEAGRSMLMAA